MTDELHYQDLLDFFKALSNIDRLKIAGLVGVQPHTAQELADKLHLRLPAVINHLQFLQHLSLVKQEGNHYQLDQVALEGVARRVLTGQRAKFNAEELEGEDYDKKVLSDFLYPDGRVISFPAQQKKLNAILRYVWQSFEPDVRYTEKEVNTLLMRYHPDTASLRRYLVDNGMLKREKGIYWRGEAKA